MTKVNSRFSQILRTRPKNVTYKQIHLNVSNVLFWCQCHCNIRCYNNNPPYWKLTASCNIQVTVHCRVCPLVSVSFCSSRPLISLVVEMQTKCGGNLVLTKHTTSCYSNHRQSHVIKRLQLCILIRNKHTHTGFCPSVVPQTHYSRAILTM